MKKTKLVGYVEMKKRKGKVLFIEGHGASAVVGVSASVEYVYDELSDKVTEESVGKEIEIHYVKGYSGKAQIADLVIK